MSKGLDNAQAVGRLGEAALSLISLNFDEMMELTESVGAQAGVDPLKLARALADFGRAHLAKDK